MKANFRNIVIRAWEIRKASAAKLGCKCSEIVWGICFNMAKDEIMSKNKKDMYIIETTGEKVESFLKAIEIAEKAGSRVIEEATGLSRWTPAKPVSEKKMQEYRNRKNAYDAYQRMIQG